MDNHKLAYTVPEACAEIGISRATLYNLWKDGLGPSSVNTGTRTLIPRYALEEWLEFLTEETKGNRVAQNSMW